MQNPKIIMDQPRFTLLIRCEDDGDEHALTTVAASTAQEALDSLMADLKQLIEEYDRNPDINED